MTAEAVRPAKHADSVGDWLVELGYTHCFFVAGGNIMHLLDAFRTRLRCVPVVHEVAAGIAVEYFNAVSGSGKALGLVTAGPGVTNVLTAMSGAFLESREQLILAGQVKASDLAHGQVRQRGIQEIDGVTLAAPVSVRSLRIEEPISRQAFVDAVRVTGRQGPVFLEYCLDAQAAPIVDPPAEAPAAPAPAEALPPPAEADVAAIGALMDAARRPVWLIGGGVSRAVAHRLAAQLEAAGVPLLTTWNGADRIDARSPLYMGRPNTWGQRSANLVLQQADLVVALGTRLGLQQTGFNWPQFAPVGKVVQVDIDATELEKGHPRVDLALPTDANALLEQLVARPYPSYAEWIAYARNVRDEVPLIEENATGPSFVSPYAFYERLGTLTRDDDVIVVCSSGGANSVGMQITEPRLGQIVLCDKGLASMGYGLSGAIGAAFAAPDRRVLLVEGDGGFAQNLQELATVAVNDLNVKIMIFDNSGYASIRMTQLNYFGGSYIGCDDTSGLGFPDWEDLFRAYRIPCVTLDADGFAGDLLASALDADGPAGVIVRVDPEQTYFPKISSRVTASGSMESNPLHRMTPDLPDELYQRVGRYLPA